MANLQFAYASLEPAGFPKEVAQALPPRQWQVRKLTFEGTRDLGTLPDFTWLDLGDAANLAHSKTVIKHLAQLKPVPSTLFSVFISGTAPKPKTHESLVRFILSSFSDPSALEIDLQGQPDVLAALLKFATLRQKRKLPAAATVSPAAPVISVPNADLRTARGRLSIKLVAELFCMDVIEIGRLIGRPNKAALSKTPDAEALQEPLRPFADIALLRSPVFGNAAFRKWLNIPNENLQNRAPIDWIREGRVHDVGGFAYGIITGQPN